MSLDRRGFIVDEMDAVRSPQYYSRSERFGQTPWHVVAITRWCVMTYGLLQKEGDLNCRE